MKRKTLTLIAASALALTFGAVSLAGCATTASADYITTAIARPSTSGTRGAFDELVKNSEGNTLAKVPTFADCVLEASETGNVIVNVSQNVKALGYISLGSVAGNKDIKAVKVENVEATVENITSGDYKLARPFNLVYPEGETLNDLTQNFISFIESTEGQQIINQEYIGQVKNPVSYVAYTGTVTTLTLTGSTSVQPLMRTLAAKYQELNTSKNITINISGSGSGQGITDAQAGNNDLGMISRDLKAGETGLTAYKMADDGIAVIVNAACPLTNVTMDQIYNLYANGTQIECK